MKKIFEFIVQQWSLVILLIICALVAILQIFTIFKVDTLGLILVLLNGFILYQIVENAKLANAIKRVEEFKSSGAFVKVLPSARDFFIFATQLIEKTSISIDACYFTPFPPTKYFGDSDKSIKRYWDSFGKLVQTRKNVSFRRIITPDNHEKSEWIKDHVEEFKKANNFSVAILQINPIVPLLNVMIIDGKNAFIFSPHGPDSRHYLWVEDQQFCQGMQEYFDNLWRSSTIIKDGPNLDMSAFAELIHENSPA